MNKINPKKLFGSKWTAVKPSNKEKHFIVCELEFDENDVVNLCVIEAVISKRLMPIEWEVLKDANQWIQGWK